MLTLDKMRHTWWKCVLEGDPEIDTSKVESTKRVEECAPQRGTDDPALRMLSLSPAAGLPRALKLTRRIPRPAAVFCFRCLTGRCFGKFAGVTGGGFQGTF